MGLNGSGLGGLSEGFLLVILACSAFAAATLVLILARSGGKRRDQTMARKFPGAVVVGAARTSEVLSAFRKIAAPSHADPRLPLTFTAVIDAHGLSLWAGSSRAPRALLEIPAHRISGCDFSTINDGGLSRPTVEFRLNGLPANVLPISPIGAGPTGLSPLAARRVADIAEKVARDLEAVGRNPADEAGGRQLRLNAPKGRPSRSTTWSGQ